MCRGGVYQGGYGHIYQDIPLWEAKRGSFDHYSLSGRLQEASFDRYSFSGRLKEVSFDRYSFSGKLEWALLTIIPSLGG